MTLFGMPYRQSLFCFVYFHSFIFYFPRSEAYSVMEKCKLINERRLIKGKGSHLKRFFKLRDYSYEDSCPREIPHACAHAEIHIQLIPWSQSPYWEADSRSHTHVGYYLRWAQMPVPKFYTVTLRLSVFLQTPRILL
jgi:hypothetical protein